MMWQRPFLVLSLAALLGGALGCSSKAEEKTDKGATPAETKTEGATAGSAAGSGSAATPPAPVRPSVEAVKPSIDIKAPPADAVKLPSGMIYKKLAAAEGIAPGRNDMLSLHVTGWKTGSGETFITTKTRGNPMMLSLASAGQGFVDVFTQLKKGEKAMIWMPAALVEQGGAPGKPEDLAYEVEVVDIQPAPAVPADVAAPPANAKSAKGGLRYVVVEPGTGKAKARYFDTASFRYTVWDASGKMLSSTEQRSRPMNSALYRQPAALENIMTTMVAGQKTRFWIDAEQAGTLTPPGGKGQLCYELQLLEITAGKQPPPTPADVKAPPAGAKKTAQGVSYKVLKPGKGTAKPTASDTVKVNYTGWTTDGRMFDSSVVRGEPTSFPLNGVIKGWTDGIPQMVAGETTRFWIPEELAYKGQPNNPQGMLVFDVELIEILPPAGAAPGSPSGNPHGGNPHGGAPDPHGAPPSPHSEHDGHGH